ncbi:RdgB/HAM1 family non-canonical purine NTP pyrophosphatase [Sulfuriroseicoccus oceanibius]|uniref:dITP/XTP pyrophosphatase n=1 Tax=Sulfuriroseicoccus oceanibius TaxID=2707525 RepID=A0A6B3L1N2_9BACT|nr:RdgB/HAM1 family non-canonical purine NTP pyrophosphatase [Sulfuriroseicoccus oceanibius]QQL44366.1 RdgB/HAM1 family non-canonical purine NTP pyrophosphatase [Sulfuriroseicoccus oceanibius]
MSDLLLPTLLIATRNAHKTEEFAEMLAPFAEVVDLTDPDFENLPEIDETGTTFDENSLLKSASISKITGGITLADDSGLEVDALDGAPGIYSARYSGDNATDATNREKLLSELKDAPAPRTARFRCVLALTKNGQTLGTWSGALEGTIGFEEAGDAGFGYDPVFIPEGDTRTLAEYTADEKNAISHRGRAVEKLVAALRNGEVALG